MRRYTNCFVEVQQGRVVATLKSTYRKPVTEEEARAEGQREEKEKWYLKYLGILNVDVTSADLKRMLKAKEIARLPKVEEKDENQVDLLDII